MKRFPINIVECIRGSEDGTVLVELSIQIQLIECSEVTFDLVTNEIVLKNCNADLACTNSLKHFYEIKSSNGY